MGLLGSCYYITNAPIEGTIIENAITGIVKRAFSYGVIGAIQSIAVTALKGYDPYCWHFITGNPCFLDTFGNAFPLPLWRKIIVVIAVETGVQKLTTTPSAIIAVLAISMTIQAIINLSRGNSYRRFNPGEYEGL